MSDARWTPRFRNAIVLLAVVALSACSGSSTGSPVPVPSVSAASSASSANALQDVEQSTVFIAVEGRFTDQ
jgi:uncharacterized lipoprotein YbaY